MVRMKYNWIKHTEIIVQNFLNTGGLGIHSFDYSGTRKQGIIADRKGKNKVSAWWLLNVIPANSDFLFIKNISDNDVLDV